MDPSTEQAELDLALQQQFGHSNVVVVAPVVEAEEEPSLSGRLWLRDTQTALPHSMPEVEAMMGEEAFDTFEKCISEAKRKNDHNHLTKWIAEKRAQSKTSQKRKEKKNALRSARYHYYESRSPQGNVDASF